MRIILSSFILLCSLAACKKSALPVYNNDSDIYFSYYEAGVLTDSVNISFAMNDTLKTDTAIFYVNLMGKLMPQDRPYKLEADAAGTTAIAGTHYNMPAATSLFIAGNTNRDSVTIQGMRTADIRDKSVMLYLRIVPNEYFKAGMSVFDYKAPTIKRATVLRVVIDDLLPKPASWAASEAFLGVYSREKLTLMVKIIVLQLNRFYPTGTVTAYTATQLNNYARQFQAYLNTQQAQGNTVYEKNGSVMVMGPSAQ